MPTQVLAAHDDRDSMPLTARVMTCLEEPSAFWQSRFFASRASAVLFWVLLLAIGAGRAWVGLAGERAFAHDGFMVLDGAWRMVNGQRPHLDFNSMIGPAAYLPTILGFRFCHGSADGLAYGQALVAVLLGGWAWFLGEELSPAARFLYALCVAALAGSPALVGASPFELTPGMTYNRFTYALLGLVLLECVRGPKRLEFAGGLSSGAALALVLFVKMTGIFVGCFLVMMLIPLRRQRAPRWSGMVCGFLLLSLPLLAYLRFGVGAIWRDLSLTAAAKHMVFYDRFDFGSIFLEVGFAALLVLMASAWLGSVSGSASGTANDSRRLLWAVAVVVAASLALLISNFQRATLPLLTLMLVLMVDSLLRRTDQGKTGVQVLRPLVIAGGSLYVAVLLLSLATSLIAGAALKVFVAPRRPHMNTPVLRPFVPVGDEIPYTHWINDGLALLARHRLAGERVMALDFTNPFTFGLHLPPAAGGTSNLQYRGSFDDVHKLTPEQLYGAAELVMMPKDFTDPTLTKSVPRLYGPYLETHYRLIGESEDWKLYRRIS